MYHLWYNKYMVNSVLPIRFYASLMGNEPVREWLKSLSHAEKKNIGEDIKTLQIGWPIGMPLVKYVGDSLYELRSTLPTNKIARIIFFFFNGEIILLHGFIKKSQKIELSDLELAKKRKSEIVSHEQ